MKDETVKVLWIATLIVVLEIVALYLGYNGLGLTAAIGGLCGLGGYELNNILQVLKGDKDDEPTAE